MLVGEGQNCGWTVACSGHWKLTQHQGFFKNVGRQSQRKAMRVSDPQTHTIQSLRHWVTYTTHTTTQTSIAIFILAILILKKSHPISKVMNDKIYIRTL